MRYLKTFESVDLENDLKDFCEMNLAYLLDNDDFRLSVIWQGHGYMGRAKDCYNINLCKLDDYSSSTGFTWNEVKDYYIPFLHMLNNEYKIMSNEDLNIGKKLYRQDGGDWKEPCIALYNGGQNFCVSVKDILSGDPLPLRYDDVDLLEITLRVEMKKIDESVELKIDEIEHYLAYLIDEGFEVKPIIPGGGFADVKPQQAICLERKLTREEWQSILKTGLEHKSVIIGVRSEPMKVHNPSQFKPAVLLSNFKCNLLDSIEYLAQDATDKLLLSLSDQFSTTKIIMSFKVGAGHVQQYNFGDISIRLQIILID